MNRRRGMTAAAVVAAAAAATAGGWWASHDAPAAGAAVNTASSAVPTATATVVRSTITTSEQDSGMLGYAGSFTVYTGLTGTVTWLPATGAVIRPGHRLFAVDGQDVILFAGQRPAWREFAPGMGGGPDVGELQRNLIALGYDPYHAITVNDQYDWATQAAVLRWQAALGLPLAQRDAVIPLGQVAFLPSRVQVAAVNTGTGATVAPGAVVLAVTSTRPVAYVALPTSERSLVRRGETVTVTLPSGVATRPGSQRRHSDRTRSEPGPRRGLAAVLGLAVLRLTVRGHAVRGSDDHGRGRPGPPFRHGRAGPGTRAGRHSHANRTQRARGADQRPAGQAGRRLPGRGGAWPDTAAGDRADGSVRRLQRDCCDQRAGHRRRHQGGGAGAMMTSGPVLELKDVGKVYPATPPVPAVSGVSLTVMAGELVAVVGPSGSGKTTLLHLMAALDRPSSGSVRVAGAEIAAMSDRQLSALRAYRIGVVFQQFFLIDTQTALDNVAAGLLYRGIPAAQRRRRAAGALDRVGLSSRAGHRAQQLSGGERQRVAIARAVVGEPAIVLADEPTGNLDSAASAVVMSDLCRLNMDGTTLVIITHEPGVAAVAGRRIEVLDGRIVADRAVGASEGAREGALS